MAKSILCFLMSFLIVGQVCIAQSYVVSGIEKTDKDAMQYEILGKVGSHYWVFKNNEGISTIAQYNNQMQLVKQNDLAFLPKALNSLEFITYTNKVFVFYQFQVNTTVYAATASLNEEGQLVGSPKIIDTAEKIRPGSGSKVFNLLQSDDRNRMVIFSVNTTNPSLIKVKSIALNNNFEDVSESEISIKSLNKKSTLSDFALDNQGNLFCLRSLNFASIYWSRLPKAIVNPSLNPN